MLQVCSKPGFPLACALGACILRQSFQPARGETAHQDHCYAMSHGQPVVRFPGIVEQRSLQQRLISIPGLLQSIKDIQTVPLVYA